MIETRDAQAADVAFVMSNWLRTWRTSPWAGCIPNDEYHDVTRRGIEQLIARGAKIRVATVKDRLVAFLCHEVTPDGRTVAHAGHEKDVYAGLAPLAKLAKDLPCGVPYVPGPVLVTFRTPALTRALEAAGHRWVHSPEVARRK